ncbi:unnamed protein product [Trichogramma brassicae]|uniref:Uncharacterized protein n=1 Tax=Trichogramma brassicae TaxID=86971 RepID=A0A6H5I064_9HYME|nr:unnamed protein product [Trichogramma brassicae]
MLSESDEVERRTAPSKQQQTYASGGTFGVTAAASRPTHEGQQQQQHRSDPATAATCPRFPEIDSRRNVPASHRSRHGEEFYDKTFETLRIRIVEKLHSKSCVLEKLDYSKKFEYPKKLEYSKKTRVPEKLEYSKNRVLDSNSRKKLELDELSFFEYSHSPTHPALSGASRAPHKACRVQFFCI